jgi:hypothetical protein
VRKAMTIDAPIAAQVEGPYANWNPPPPSRSSLFAPRIATGQDGSAQGRCTSSAKCGGSTTDIVRRETEFPRCLFTGDDQRGFILQPGDAT